MKTHIKRMLHALRVFLSYYVKELLYVPSIFFALFIIPGAQLIPVFAFILGETLLYPFLEKRYEYSSFYFFLKSDFGHGTFIVFSSLVIPVLILHFVFALTSAIDDPDGYRLGRTR